MNQTWTRLKPLHKAGLIVAALALAGGGSAVAINAFSSDDGPAPAFVAPEQQASDPAPSATTEEPAEAGTHKKTLTETKPIKFKTRTVKDNWLPKGQKERLTAGIDGVRTLTYSVTLVDGKETGRKLVKSVVTRKPVDEVTSVGTATAN